MGFFKPSLIFLLICCVEPSGATLPCYHNQALRDFLSINNNIQHVAVYGDKDGRQTEEEYAAANGFDVAFVKKQYAATGQLKCKSGVATAQLTFKDNIITTAAHVLNDFRTCAETSKPNECSFTYKLDGKENTIQVDSLVDQGYKCPSYHDDEADWAVMKLKSRATGVVPYSVPSENDRKLKQEQKVLAVASMSIDFQRKDPASGKKIFPKHFENCPIKAVYGGRMPFYLATACSGAKGSSGGGLLSLNPNNPTLLAIMSSGKESVDLQNQAMRTGVPNKGSFNEEKWANFSVPVNGTFLAAILNAGD